MRVQLARRHRAHRYIFVETEGLPLTPGKPGSDEWKTTAPVHCVKGLPSQFVSATTRCLRHNGIISWRKFNEGAHKRDIHERHVRGERHNEIALTGCQPGVNASQRAGVRELVADDLARRRQLARQVPKPRRRCRTEQDFMGEGLNALRNALDKWHAPK
jgi:hypothetical protein